MSAQLPTRLVRVSPVDLMAVLMLSKAAATRSASALIWASSALNLASM
jgi:hypothetical protein